MKRALLASALVPAVVLPALAVGQPPPGNLTLKADPSTIVFGRSTTLSGKLTGPNNDNKPIQVLADEFPFEGNFMPVASPTTNAQGDYSVAQSPSKNTRYQARRANEESQIVTVLVRIRTSLNVSDRTPRRGQRVRFSGRACPEHDGQEVRIQRRTSRGWRTVARTRLRDTGTPCSSYRRTFRVFRDARYRAVVVLDGDHATGISRSRFLNVG